MEKQPGEAPEGKELPLTLKIDLNNEELVKNLKAKLEEYKTKLALMVESVEKNNIKPYRDFVHRTLESVPSEIAEIYYLKNMIPIIEALLKKGGINFNEMSLGQGKGRCLIDSKTFWNAWDDLAAYVSGKNNTLRGGTGFGTEKNHQ